MANELKITDIVDKKALNQVASLNTRLNTLKNTYKKLAIELGGQIRVPVGDFTSLTTKAENYKTSLLSLKRTLEEMNTVQSLQEKALKSISDKMNVLGKNGAIVQLFDKLVTSMNRLTSVMEKLSNKTLTVQQVTKTITRTVSSAGSSARQLSEELENMSSDVVDTAKYLLELQTRLNGIASVMAQTKIAFEQGEIDVIKYTKEMSSLRSEYEELTEESELYRKVMTQHNTDMLKSTGSYKEVNAAMIKLRRLYKDLSAEIRESPLGQDIGKTINSLNDELKRIDAGMGNYQRNVGNYASAFNGLGYQVTQLVRELPALSSGFNTFMIAIGNNLPMLVDEISRARELNAKMAKDAQPTVPVWKQVTSAIFNWQTALVVGLTLVTMYWKDISKFFKELFTGAKAAKSVSEAFADINEQMKNNTSAFGSAMTTLSDLSDEWDRLGDNLKEKQRFVEANQERFNELGVSVENVAEAENLLIDNKDEFIQAMQQRAMSIAAANLATAEYEKAMKKQMEILEMQRKRKEEDYSLWDMLTSDLWLPKFSTDALNKTFDKNIKAANEEKAAIEETANMYIKMGNDAEVAYNEILRNAGISPSKVRKQGQKERDILEELLQTRIDLIEDERKRELAQNEKDFQEKMEGLDKESELYKNYAELMRRNEAAINDKYDKLALKAREEAADREVEFMQEKYAQRAVIATQGVQKELEALSKEYAKGLIDAEEYEEKRTAITNQYAIESAQVAIDAIKEQLKVADMSAEKRQELLDALASAEMALGDAVIASNEEQAKAREEALQRAREGFEALRDVADLSIDGMADLMDGLYSIFEAIEKGGKDTFAGILAGAMQMVSGVKDMVSGMYESQIEELEKEQEANDEAQEKEMDRIEQLAEFGAISEEEAEARKRAAEDKTAAKTAEVEKKKAELMTKQAKFEKAMNISQTIMATALAVTKSLPNIVLAALVGAMGAVQLATIIAQPIPKYAKGTKSHKGGLAIVGDGGKREGVITDKGLWVTPDVPTLVDLPKGTVVIPDITKYTTHKGLKSDIQMMSTRKNGDNPVIVNVDNDYTRLEKEMSGNRNELRKLNKVMKKMSKASELRGIYGRL